MTFTARMIRKSSKNSFKISSPSAQAIKTKEIKECRLHKWTNQFRNSQLKSKIDDPLFIHFLINVCKDKISINAVVADGQTNPQSKDVVREDD